MERKITNPVIRDTTTFIRTVAETEGRFTEVEVTLMPGGGTPVHYHKHFAETFTAIDGVLGVQLGDGRKIRLNPGETYTIYPMEAHRFFNPTDVVVKFNVLVEPGSRGFEQSLQILYGLAVDGLTDKKALPKSLSHTAIILTMSDINASGFLSFMLPVFKWIANKERKKGTEQMLIQKYCRW